jgi:NO-binding membrane sensor protein with MHYT domain
MRQPIDIDYVSKAIVGMASPLLGLVTSYQEQIEWHLRVASLLVGLAVGIMSLVGMVRKMRRK